MGRWLHVELDFGSGDDESTIRIDATSLVRIKGRVDRVDELGDGTLRVVDYKTGKPGQKYSSGTTHGAYNGGRQLQPAVYAAAVSARIDKAVSRFEYRFPTERGQNEIVGYDGDALISAAAVIPDLLVYIKTGAFIATNDGNDCGYCAYRENCRAPESKTDMPARVRWAIDHAEAIDQYRSMLTRRAAPEKE
jgi:CRISPR/Cas system-associated exonuclease Cas4 (RecB family)